MFGDFEQYPRSLLNRVNQNLKRVQANADEPAQHVRFAVLNEFHADNSSFDPLNLLLHRALIFILQIPLIYQEYF